MQVRNLGCRRASGFIGTSAVCHVPLPDEFLHHRPKTADSRPINKLVVVADAADPPVRDWTGADAGGPKQGRSQRCHTPEKSGVDAMASAPLSPAAGVTVCARAGAVPVANLSPTLCRNAVLRSTGRPCLRSRSAKASSANSWAMSSPEPEGARWCVFWVEGRLPHRACQLSARPSQRRCLPEAADTPRRFEPAGLGRDRLPRGQSHPYRESRSPSRPPVRRKAVALQKKQETFPQHHDLPPCLLAWVITPIQF